MRAGLQDSVSMVEWLTALVQPTYHAVRAAALGVARGGGMPQHDMPVNMGRFSTCYRLEGV